MTPNLDRQTLEHLIAEGTIDTILVCMVDMQGRLIGKRVTGHFFRDHAIKEMHVCDYLPAWASFHLAMNVRECPTRWAISLAPSL